jgi:hypothetical protein
MSIDLMRGLRAADPSPPFGGPGQDFTASGSPAGNGRHRDGPVHRSGMSRV